MWAPLVGGEMALSREEAEARSRRTAHIRLFSRSINPSEQVDELAAMRGRIDHALLLALLEAEASGSWTSNGLEHFHEWVAQRLDISWFRARQLVACARSLEKLPLTSEALRSGTLGLDKVIHLVRYATPEKEARQIAWARRKDFRDVKQRAEEKTSVSKEEIEMAETNRRTSSRLSPDGLTMELWSRMPALEGMLVMSALEERAAQLEPTPEDPDPELFGDHLTKGALLTDALVMSVLGSCDVEGTCEGTMASPGLMVHAELDVLRGEGSARIEDGPALHPAIVEQIACDARIQNVVEQEGKAVAASVETYTPPRWMRRQLKNRDRSCVFPGCRQRKFLQPHHITPYPEGRTCVENLVCLCWRHHKLVHVFGWRVALGSGPQDFPLVEWYRPDGRRFEPGRSPAT
jgi:Domain of unknown function (DUF222)